MVTRHQFVARIAGLPYEIVAGLRCPRAHLVGGRCARRAEARLGALGARISDLLSGYVRMNDDDSERRALLAIRRQVFNNRLPKKPDEAMARIEAIGGEAGHAAAGWLRDRVALAELERCVWTFWPRRPSRPEPA